MMFGRKQDIRAVLNEEQFQRLMISVVERLDWTHLNALINVQSTSGPCSVPRGAIKIENLTVHLDGEGSKLIAEAIAERLIPSMVVPKDKENGDENALKR